MISNINFSYSQIQINYIDTNYSPINEISDYFLLDIFKHLSYKENIENGIVCKRWYSLKKELNLKKEFPLLILIDKIYWEKVLRNYNLADFLSEEDCPKNITNYILNSNCNISDLEIPSLLRNYDFSEIDHVNEKKLYKILVSKGISKNREITCLFIPKNFNPEFTISKIKDRTFRITSEATKEEKSDLSNQKAFIAIMSTKLTSNHQHRTNVITPSFFESIAFYIFKTLQPNYSHNEWTGKPGYTQMVVSLKEKLLTIASLPLNDEKAVDLVINYQKTSFNGLSYSVYPEIYVKIQPEEII